MGCGVSNTPDTGPPIYQPISMTFDGVRDRAILVDSVRNALMMVDLPTGERVVFAR